MPGEQLATGLPGGWVTRGTCHTGWQRAELSGTTTNR